MVSRSNNAVANSQSTLTESISSVTLTEMSVLAGSTGEVSSTSWQPGMRSLKSTLA
ncbi:hypothetical protein D3C76_409910 [compost metagenome]